ncbi:GTP-binding protein Sar1 [Spironucleus salmonicida]|uniref:GTP-binding protein Sar1 n=1 Tax=Spironucleus salmonicida TaxID=348837 RepID=V6LSA5_9EUKA|nr:GTP-binding protein Sar1 [Spironucleus salmonicida]|eukprot:EST46576.1 GTP-binding protein Sar1 [Spironucleus salmonicida]
MGILNWFRGVLSSLGLWSKKANIVFLGLDNAGKSTLLAMLKNSSAQQIAPTQHPTSQVLQIGQIQFKTYDLGGHEVARRVWEEYLQSAQGIVYLVDIADPSRFNESKDALTQIIRNKDFNKLPIMILANKIDKPTAVSPDDVLQALGLHDQVTGKDAKVATGQRPLEVFPCSVINREGYAEGFQWLGKFF